jgi:hypothetical protein
MTKKKKFYNIGSRKKSGGFKEDDAVWGDQKVTGTK